MIRYFAKKIVSSGKNHEKSNFWWNLLGSGIYAFSSMLLTILVVRIIGEEVGGTFAIALTISQMLVYIGYFETRTFQITDNTKEFKFGDYLTSKLITCSLMIAISCLYIILKGYSFDKGIIVLLMCIYRLMDAIADVFEGSFHANNRLDLAGKSMFFRTLSSVGILIVTLEFTKSLVISLCISIIVAVLGIVVCDIFVMKEYGQIKFGRNIKTILNLLIKCFPMFLGVFLWTYLLSAPRLAIDNNMSSQYQTYFIALFMPVSIINLLSTFILKPSLLQLSDSFHLNLDKFKKLFIKLIMFIGGITLTCMIGAYLLGIPVLSILYGCNLSPYKKVLVFLMLSGGLNALSVLIYYVLIIMRKQSWALIGYMISAVLAYLICDFCVKKSGIFGAALSYFIINSVLCLCLFVAYFIAGKINYNCMKS